MSVLAVRLLLIVSLAAASPAWCCCALRALGGGEAMNVEGTLSCCSRDLGPDDRLAGDAGCCPTAIGECSVSDTPCEDDSSCRCADRVIDQQRLDTSIKVAAPRLGLDWVAAREPIIPSGVRGVTATTTGDATRAWHPPPRTLLAHHCLLLL